MRHCHSKRRDRLIPWPMQPMQKLPAARLRRPKFGRSATSGDLSHLSITMSSYCPSLATHFPSRLVFSRCTDFLGLRLVVHRVPLLSLLGRVRNGPLALSKLLRLANSRVRHIGCCWRRRRSEKICRRGGRVGGWMGGGCRRRRGWIVELDIALPTASFAALMAVGPNGYGRLWERASPSREHGLCKQQSSCH